MKIDGPLPDSFLRCLSPADRKSLGQGQMTAEEALSKAKIRNERNLQANLVNLLRLYGIEPLWFATHKKTRATKGWADITFAVQLGGYFVIRACLWEVKLLGEVPTEEQAALHTRLSAVPNGWRISIIHSVLEGINDLRKLGLQPCE